MASTSRSTAGVYGLGGLTGVAAAAWSVFAEEPARFGGVAAIPVLAASVWALAQPQRWIPMFLIAALCLPPLPIPLGNSGPHPAVAVALLGMLAGALHWMEWKRPVPSEAIGLVIYFLVLLGSVSFAALYSGEEIAAASLARVLLFGISLYVFFFTVCTRSEPGFGTRGLFWAGLLSAFFACLDFFLQLPAPAGFGPQFVWLASGIYRRAQGVFYEASTLGNFCAFFLVMVAVSLSRPRRESPIGRWMVIAGGPVFFAALLLSFSRASLLGLSVAILTLLILNRKRFRLWRVAGILALAVIVGAAATYAFAPAIVEGYWTRLEASVWLAAGGNETVLSGRLYTWNFLARFLADHPEHAFFGVGYKTLPYSDFIGQQLVADNGYLSSLVETGLVGLAALILFHISIFRMGWRAAVSKDHRAAFFGTWITCFWAGEVVQMLSGDLLTYWRVLPVYLWVLAMAVRYSEPPVSA
jgi:O-antigen ligase